jgi:hypothetical protein
LRTPSSPVRDFKVLQLLWFRDVSLQNGWAASVRRTRRQRLVTVTGTTSDTKEQHEVSYGKQTKLKDITEASVTNRSDADISSSDDLATTMAKTEVIKI